MVKLVPFVLGLLIMLGVIMYALWVFSRRGSFQYDEQHVWMRDVDEDKPASKQTHEKTGL
ncbi:hypothetical protein [Paenibacillus apiarius]|uniref:YtzI protein n=1 Tax=Paenibacillus apiarius TaxID=46240 RepID=A0ABT4DP84_9BACL|nr:hypothetical protein [Paenibacillus apiarius]MBN3524891.1 hypothetical protein [Paenibacillus apiarius]MCY9515242.1 hypothetical protein [Paenibacillus apiarius]MCY9519119.1 hypothetical protein [Paenibacillus apiarius]MCY9550299.1 hypothetical protein [Paenibacillus apiarius]MCY9561153.1 hypothetical protein [Paenibacillus apiarius]